MAPSGDQTMEGLFRIYEQGRPSLAMLCDDAATFLGGHSLKAEQKVGTTANLCRAWDGSKLERIRGGDGVTVLYDRRLATHLMVQSGVAAEFLGDRQFADQGLLARFLVAAPAGRAGTRFRDDVAYQVTARRAAAHLEEYNAAVLALLRAPIRWKSGSDRSLGVDLEQLGFTAKGRSLYVGFANAIEKEMGPNNSLASAKAFASKLPENAARLAGVLTMVDRPDADEIDEHTLADAIELAKFYLSEAMRLIASGSIDPSLRQANTLREWLLARDGDVVALRTVYQFGPNSIRSAGKAREAMSILAEHGWVVALKEGAEIEGEFSKDAWRIVRC